MTMIGYELKGPRRKPRMVSFERQALASGSALAHDPAMTILDPRTGDAEDDRSSTKAKSLASLAGGMLTEISPVKVLFAFSLLVVLPNLILGFAPLIITAWFTTVSAEVFATTTIGSALIIGLLIGVALYGWRPLFTVLETNFWSLNALLVQPMYILLRETLRHYTGRRAEGMSTRSGPRHARLTAAAAGFLSAAAGLAFMVIAWRWTRWHGAPIDLARPLLLVIPAIANSVVIVAAYAAVASIVSGLADAAMAETMDLEIEAIPAGDGQAWRVAHLSDVHVVGEGYGFRIESGRGGPRGNERFHAVLEKLAAIHAADPLHAILFSGDMTDAGRSSEWAEFLDALEAYPQLLALSLILPGNHDVNIIDRANPARLELPWSSARQLRRTRVLSAMERIHGGRTYSIDETDFSIRWTLTQALAPHGETLRSFAISGGFRGALKVEQLWRETFPQVVPPSAPDGLGFLLLDTNADAHFSFTNALGFLSMRQAHAIEAAMQTFPKACWVIALHHHLLEYPRAAEALSMRLGTALINGSWVVRNLKHNGHRFVVMHGHRHVDWLGRCGEVRIISGPSAVMGAPEAKASYFLIHTFHGGDGKLSIAAPQRVNLPAISRSREPDASLAEAAQ